MIIGIGHDIVEIERIMQIFNKYDYKFVKKILHNKELERFINLKHQKSQMAFLAKRYAAKEALSKALGTGFRNGIKFHDIIITNNELGKPIVNLQNAALNILKKLVKDESYNINISLSDESNIASAYVIIESL